MKFVLLILLFVTILDGIRTNDDESDDIPELRYLEPSVNPCDNFYQFTCGNFKEYHPRPEHVDIISQYGLLQDKLLETGKEILSSPKTNQDPVALKKVKSAYHSCVNTEFADDIPAPEYQLIKEFGGLPLLSITDDENIEFTWNDIGDLVGNLGVPILFNFVVSQTSPRDYFLFIQKDGTDEPNFIRPNHLKNYDELLEEVLIEDAKTVEAFASTLGTNHLMVFLEEVTDNLFNYSMEGRPLKDKTEQDLHDVIAFQNLLYNYGGIIEPDAKILPLDVFTTVGGLQEWTDKQFQGEVDLNWIEYLTRILGKGGVHIDENFPVVAFNTVLYGIINLVRQTDLRIVKNYALLKNFLFLALDSDEPTREALRRYFEAKNISFHPRETYCLRKLLDVVESASFNYAVAYQYKNYHFNQNIFTKVNKIMNGIIEAFEDMLKESEWLDNESRNATLEKLNDMIVLFATPEIADNKDSLDKFYENVRICEWDNYGNAQRIRAYKQAYTFSKFDKRTRNFWDKSSFDTNAYYNPANNRIVLPISMMNEPFYHENPVIAYGRLGSLIGHETSHGYDENGLMYDPNGNQMEWWTSEAKAEFTERVKCFEEQYNQYYIPEIDSFVNASNLNCRSEILADNGGIRHAFRALQTLKKTEHIAGVRNFTAEQLFFIGFGTMWCSEESNSYLRKLNTEYHYPPARYRVNGVASNMKEFAEAFSCPVGSNMNPENKCLLW